MMDKDTEMKGDTITNVKESETFETDSQENPGTNSVIFLLIFLKGILILLLSNKYFSSEINQIDLFPTGRNRGSCKPLDVFQYECKVKIYSIFTSQTTFFLTFK